MQIRNPSALKYLDNEVFIGIDDLFGVWIVLPSAIYSGVHNLH